MSYPHRNRLARMRSPDGAYELIEVKDGSGLFVTYCVCLVDDTWTNILYTASSGFSGMWSVQGAWARYNNDFFVLSGDAGAFCYRYEGSSWQEYILTYSSEHASYYLRRMQTDNSLSDERVIYSNENVPDMIVDYFIKHDI